jgi:hypothetical protein
MQRHIYGAIVVSINDVAKYTPNANTIINTDEHTMEYGRTKYPSWLGSWLLMIITSRYLE